MVAAAGRWRAPGATPFGGWVGAPLPVVVGGRSLTSQSSAHTKPASPPKPLFAIRRPARWMPVHRLLEAMLPCGYHCATDLYPVDRATVRIVLSCRLCRADPYGVFSVAMGGRPPSASAIIRLTVGVGCALQPVCILAATECHCQSCYRVSCGGGWRWVLPRGADSRVACSLRN